MANDIKWNGAAVTKQVLKLNEQTIKKAAVIVLRRAKQVCPVDTGTLKRSIFFKIHKPQSAMIGTNITYAPYVELGTKFQEAQPFLSRALQESQSKIRQLYKNQGK